MNAEILTALLREPKEVAERCEEPEGLRDLAATSLLCVLVGAAAFGAAVGSFRGGLQIGHSAIKLPLAILATLVVTVPAFFSLTVGFGGVSRFRTIAAVALAASARGALVLVACAPVLWLAVDRGLGYHQAVLLAACMYAASGLSALGIVLHGLGGSLRAVVTAAACGVVFFAVLGQTAWMLRPFFGRPAQHAVPFVRAREGTFADALVKSGRSAAGVYDHVSRARAVDHDDSHDEEER
jgi:hypothetical protein